AGSIDAFSGGGASATNNITNATSAFIGASEAFTPTGNSLVKAQGDVLVSAMDTSTITAKLPTISIAAGLVAVAGAVSVSENTIDDTIDAAIGQAQVTSTTGNVKVTADSSGTVRANTLAVAIAAGIGAGIALVDA